MKQTVTSISSVRKSGTRAGRYRNGYWSSLRQTARWLNTIKATDRGYWSGYTEDRARKDAYNREKGIRRLEKAYHRGTLTKDNINKRGYNKFLKMEGDVKVTINYEKLEKDAKWDGLKGYLTNANISVNDVYAAYHNLWHVEGPSAYQNQRLR